MQVEFQDGLYIADRKLGQALHAVQLEQKERFCVKIRVIPLCPHTAKVVLANSSQKPGKPGIVCVFPPICLDSPFEGEDLKLNDIKS